MVRSQGKQLIGTSTTMQVRLVKFTILRMMTTNAAQLLGVERERGAIKVGQAADIIATNTNPLDDIRALKQVSFVMKDGRVFKQTK